MSKHKHRASIDPAMIQEQVELLIWFHSIAQMIQNAGKRNCEGAIKTKRQSPTRTEEDARITSEEDEINCESEHRRCCCQGRKTNLESGSQPHQSHTSSVSRSSAENLIKLYCLNGLSAPLSDSCLLRALQPNAGRV